MVNGAISTYSLSSTLFKALQVLALVGVLWSPVALADDISLTLDIDRTSLSLGETATLNATLKGGGRNVPAPDISKLSAFDILNRSSSINFQSINGVSETSTVHTMTIAPKQAGTFVIGPAVVVAKGKTYRSNTLTVTVTPEQPATKAQAGGQKKDLFIEAVVDNRHPYVGEQILLTVRFYHAVNLLSQPSYTPPQTTDFWSDVISSQPSYYTTIGGRRYRVLEINTALYPTRSGKLQIGRAFLETQIADRRRQDKFGFGSFFNRGKAVKLRTRPLEVDVKPLPTANKPQDFSGVVGSYSITASADQSSVEVNTPVTVTYRISGLGNIKVLPRPKTPETKDFRVYDGSSEENVTKDKKALGGVKTFEQTFIPTHEGRLKIPGVAYDFFDPKEGEYKVVHTPDIPLNVEPSSQALSSPSPFSFGPNTRVGSEMSAIRYIKKSSHSFQPIGAILLFKRSYIVVNTIPILALLGALLYRRRRDKLVSDVGYARAKSAARMANKRLKRARALAKVETAEAFFSEIRQSILSFVADKLNVSPHGLTFQQVSELLGAAGFDDEELEKCRRLIQRADYVRYSSGTTTEADMRESLELAGQMMIRLQEVNFARR